MRWLASWYSYYRATINSPFPATSPRRTCSLQPQCTPFCCRSINVAIGGDFRPPLPRSAASQKFAASKLKADIHWSQGHLHLAQSLSAAEQGTPGGSLRNPSSPPSGESHDLYRRTFLAECRWVNSCSGTPLQDYGRRPGGHCIETLKDKTRAPLAKYGHGCSILFGFHPLPSVPLSRC